MAANKLILLCLILAYAVSTLSKSTSALVTPGSDIAASEADTGPFLTNEIPATTSDVQSTHLHNDPMMNVKRKQSPKFAVLKHDKNLMNNPLIGALINTLLENKEVLISKMVEFGEQVLSTIITEMHKLLHRMLPGVIPPVKNQRKFRMSSARSHNMTAGMSQRRSDIFHDSRTPHAFENSELNDSQVDEIDEDKTLFNIPMINQPVSYNDIIVAQRLVYDSIDAYRTWQSTHDENESI